MLISNVVEIGGNELGLRIVVLIKDIEYALYIAKDFTCVITIDDDSNITIE